MRVIFISAIEQPFSFTNPNHRFHALYFCLGKGTTTYMHFILIPVTETPVPCVLSSFLQLNNQCRAFHSYFCNRTTHFRFCNRATKFHAFNFCFSDRATSIMSFFFSAAEQSGHFIFASAIEQPASCASFSFL
jgi:hypothetical protein